MNSIIDNDKQVDFLIKNGKHIIENNEFFKDLSNLMETKEFQIFYSKYMTNWIDIKSTAIYMRLYTEFKVKYNELSKTELDKHIVVFLLKNMMSDRELRPLSIRTINKLQQKKWNSNDFWNEFENYMLENHNQLLIKDK